MEFKDLKKNGRYLFHCKDSNIQFRATFIDILNFTLRVKQYEENGSKTCTSCGNKKEDLGGNKIYSCVKCNLTTDRDYNGCRNIFLSCISKIN